MPNAPQATLAHVQHDAEVCVIGGGMAGMCAAIAAARRGAKTVLIHDRPVLGGNASSEVRMWICGAHGRNNKETGLLEEIQLDNCRLNPTGNYSLWDAVLYAKCAFCPNLTLLLDCSCNDAVMEPDGQRIAAVKAWQLTSQTPHTVAARVFIDCSGDSILIPLTGAHYRQGREARHEFDEDIEPQAADLRTMGNSLLIQARETDEPQPFTPPPWAYKFLDESDLPNRNAGVRGHNFWWLELGGLDDTIRDAQAIRHELTRVAFGVWDFIKNHSPKRADAENWTLEWAGSLPGKRENRRYVGDHILTQNDVRDGGRFDDLIAYGGWSMDDHHPAGLLYPGKPTIFHPAPSPYGIPYRCLYSGNITNLFCAGRNISVTHAALSSTRVMATCAMIGQAAGTAAAMCVAERRLPRDLYPQRIPDLQQQLIDDDCYLPGVSRRVDELTQQARGAAALAPLRNGDERPIGDDPNGAVLNRGEAAEYRWSSPVHVGGVRLVFDSNLNHAKKMPCSIPRRGNDCPVPPQMTRGFRIEADRGDGRWETVHREAANHQRLVRLPLRVQAAGLRFVPEETWGADACRLFTFEALAQAPLTRPEPPDGPRYREVRAEVPAEDLAAPDSGLEQGGHARATVGA